MIFFATVALVFRRVCTLAKRTSSSFLSALSLIWRGTKAAVLWVMLLVSAAPLWAAAPPITTLISDVTVIDGLGEAPLLHRYVLLQEGRIASIDTKPPVVGADVVVIDGRGFYLLPGFWDMHAHTFADITTMELYLSAGVIGLRDMGCPENCTTKLGEVRQAYLSGSGVYPRLVFSGPMIDGDSPYDDYPSHRQINLQTLPDALAVLQKLQVDFIKVRDFLSRDEYMALVDAGAAMQLQLAGHVPISLSVNEAVRSGLSTVEHEGSLFGGLLLACSSDESKLRDELRDMMRKATASGDAETLYAEALNAGFLDRLLNSYDPNKADALVQAFVDSGAALVPTLVMQEPMLHSADPEFNGRRKVEDEEFIDAPDTLISGWRETAGKEVLGQTFSDFDRAAMARQYNQVVKLIGKMHRAGVPILAGTDASFPDGTPWVWPGYSLHDELELLVSAGLSPSEAIASATGAATAQMGLSDTGVIATGNRADLILLGRNPLEDIRNTRVIKRVWVNGQSVDRDALLDRVKRRAEDHENYWE